MLWMIQWHWSITWNSGENYIKLFIGNKMIITTMEYWSGSVRNNNRLYIIISTDTLDPSSTREYQGYLHYFLETFILCYILEKFYFIWCVIKLWKWARAPSVWLVRCQQSVVKCRTDVSQCVEMFLTCHWSVGVLGVVKLSAHVTRTLYIIISYIVGQIVLPNKMDLL